MLNIYLCKIRTFLKSGPQSEQMFEIRTIRTKSGRMVTLYLKTQVKYFKQCSCQCRNRFKKLANYFIINYEQNTRNNTFYHFMITLPIGQNNKCSLRPKYKISRGPWRVWPPIRPASVAVVYDYSTRRQERP